MSLDRIRKLIDDSRDGSTYDGRALLEVAAAVADNSKPNVVHAGHGCGQVVGVTEGGLLEVHFDGQSDTVAVPADSVSELDTEGETR